jgi:low affinity Fe/Cu permease
VESIVTAVVTGVLALLGVLFSNSRSQAVIEVKLDELSRRVEKHNQVIERQYEVERRVSVLESELGRTRKAE